MLAALALSAGVAGADDVTVGRVGPSLSLTGNGRQLQPLGQTTVIGNFPTASALTPNGRFLWVVDSGHGKDDIQVVRVATGKVVQVLPLPGAYGGIAFTPDGKRAYVSGAPATGNIEVDQGTTRGKDGDVVHVFDVNQLTGQGVERDPISIPRPWGFGAGQIGSLPPVSKLYPAGMAASPDGKTVAVALQQADNVSLISVADGSVRNVRVGRYPNAVGFDRTGHVYAANAFDGTVSVITVKTGEVLGAIGGLNLNGRPDLNSQPSAFVADPKVNRIYVAVTQTDTVAAIDTTTFRVVGRTSVGRRDKAALGTQPTALAVDPLGTTLYVANSNEDTVAAVALTDRPGTPIKAFDLIGKLPTAAYPTSVQVTPNGRTLIWIAAKGLGSGPNPGFGFDGDKRPGGTVQTPYGSYVLDMLLGRVGRLDRPTDAQMQATTDAAENQTVPVNHRDAPSDTVLRAGGPIKHVFYIVRENRTYDQIFGSDPRGDGDPKLELFGDNSAPAPVGGVTPNAHALSRMFPLLDHVYANSEVSVDGHLITAGSIANDYSQKGTAMNYSRPGKSFDFGVFPVTLGPMGVVFDQAVRQGVSFRNYGEGGAGSLIFGEEGREQTAKTVENNSDYTYPSNLTIGCLFPGGPVGNLVGCSQDSGSAGTAGTLTSFFSRYNRFNEIFSGQLASNTVPTFNYMLLPNDHTNGTTPKAYSPQAQIADNDLGLGQIVDRISHSPIWGSSAIFVVEDDSQDGADHVDSHRMPSFVISPWAKRGAVVHTRYDQYSVLRSAEILAGLAPLTINDALATPMYDAFDTTADVEGTRYRAIAPKQPLNEVNPEHAPLAALSKALPLLQMDMVPQAVLDRLLWASVRGSTVAPPAPGPRHSAEERERAVGVLRAIAQGKNGTRWLQRHTDSDAEDQVSARRGRARASTLTRSAKRRAAVEARHALMGLGD